MDSRLARLAVAAGLALLPGVMPLAAQQIPAGEVVVYNAGSLAIPFRRLSQAFERQAPGVRVVQEHSGSLEAARKLTELGKIPDVIALADHEVFPALLVPRYAGWYALFAANEMVLAYAGRPPRGLVVGPDTWPEVLLRPEVRWGHADPAVDPAGYRTFLVFQLAERHFGSPGLGVRLAARSERRFVRPKSADLVALLQVGELDFAWEYLSVARAHGLSFVRLPAAINLGDPAHAETYARASIRVPGGRRAGADSVTIRGSPIVYAVAIPRGAPSPELAAAFVRFALSAEGSRILEEAGLQVLPRAMVRGPEAPPKALADLVDR